MGSLISRTLPQVATWLTSLSFHRFPFSLRQNREVPAFRYAPLNAGASEIRLLELQAGSWGSRIECRLLHASLDDLPEYEALSYVWGDAADTRSIRLGGCPHDVTINLEAALRHLRHQSRPRILWVDALCINQVDVEEKSVQVQMMHRIYLLATSVIAWTGVASSDSDEAIELIQAWGQWLSEREDDFMDDNPGNQVSARQGPTERPSARAERLGFSMENRNWASVWNFLERPYWTRVWVIQELATRGFLHTGKPCAIYCGSSRVNKSDFERACAGLLFILLGGDYLDPATHDVDEPMRSLFLQGRVHPAGLTMVQVLAACNGTQEHGQVRLLGLAWLMDASRHFNATDGRDKIFALLGLASEADRQFQADYGKPTSHVLADYVKFMIRQNQNLYSIVSNRREKCSAGPSWAPEIHAEHHALDLWPPARLERFSQASGDHKVDVQFDDETQCMLARGIVIGHVTKSIGPLRNAEAIPGGVASMMDILKHNGQPEIVEQLKMFAHTLKKPEYEAFWRTLVMDRVSGSLGEDDAISPAPLEVGRLSRVYFRLDPLLPSDFHPELTEAARYTEYTKPFWKAQAHALTERTFFTTSTGRYGLGPYQTQPGDLAVILYGCGFCFVLRPHGEQYEVVGNAYVHGAMDGQLVRELGGESERVFSLI